MDSAKKILQILCLPMTRFCAMGLSSCWTASPGRPSKGSVSEACLPASEPPKSLSGIPVALDIASEVKVAMFGFGRFTGAGAVRVPAKLHPVWPLEKLEGRRGDVGSYKL